MVHESLNTWGKVKQMKSIEYLVLLRIIFWPSSSVGAS